MSLGFACKKWFSSLRFAGDTPAAPAHGRGGWKLLRESGHEPFGPSAGSLDFAAAVAGARSFKGKRFNSLADHFGVSIGAMAIRLQELGLLAD